MEAHVVTSTISRNFSACYTQYTAASNCSCKSVTGCVQAFDLKELLYFDYKHLDDEKEKAVGAKFAEMDDLIKKCDVITINLPLTDKTR